MEAKQKAIKMITKYTDYCFHNFDNDAEEQKFNNAKECVLITIDEILGHLNEIASIEYHLGKSIAYWRDVIDEVKNLKFE